MTNFVQLIALDKLVAHPDNPNQQSKVNFAKLLRNIERTGRYEPLIVRPCPDKYRHSCESRNPDSKEWIPCQARNDKKEPTAGFYQIINGHHRCHALMKLGYKAADCVVWDIDNDEADVLLATLNRLAGTDRLDKKLKLLKRLNNRLDSGELAKLIPQTRKQIERLTNLKMPSGPAKIDAKGFANPMVFFLDDKQQQVVEKALSLAKQPSGPGSRGTGHETKAGRKAAALTDVAQYFVTSSTTGSRNAQ